VHGANRLASNSLLEGMVFGPRAVEAIEAGGAGPEASGAMRTVLGMDPDRHDAVPPGVIGGRFLHLPDLAPDPDALPEDPAKVRTVLQHQLTDNAGVLRDAGRLAAAGAAVEAVLRAPRGDTVADHELHNLATVARAVVESARQREESRGAHTRDDFPDTSPAFAHRIVFA
jgi:L-aspartate oxidase